MYACDRLNALINQYAFTFYFLHSTHELLSTYFLYSYFFYTVFKCSVKSMITRYDPKLSYSSHKHW